MSAVTAWGPVVEATVGTAERKHTEARVVAHVEGTREETLAEQPSGTRTGCRCCRRGWAAATCREAYSPSDFR